MIDPRLQPVLDAIAASPPPPVGASIAELRANAHAAMDMMFLALAPEAPEMVSIVDKTIPVADGEIPVRIFTPPGDAPLPVHVYLHGGGFWLGTIDQFEATCRATAAGAGCVVVSVGYRLAPEHPFPTAAEDCYAAVVWVAEHAGDLGADATRVSVGGSSAGGNLAAVVSLIARDRGGPPLVLQVLDIPVTDLTMSRPSIDENGEGYVLTKKSMADYVGYYTPDPADRRNPYASPLLADDLAGLPPAVVLTMEFDPLRDEGEAYAERLRAAGVAVTHRRFDGQFHGSVAMAKLVPDVAAEHAAVIVGALRDAYRR
jgi:acetyl esterase